MNGLVLPFHTSGCLCVSVSIGAGRYLIASALPGVAELKWSCLEKTPSNLVCHLFAFHPGVRQEERSRCLHLAIVAPSTSVRFPLGEPCRSAASVAKSAALAWYGFLLCPGGLDAVPHPPVCSRENSIRCCRHGQETGDRVGCHGRDRRNRRDWRPCNV